MALMSDVDLPVSHIREQVASAIDVVVHMARLRDGRRVIHEVAVVEGLVEGEPHVAEVFSFEPRAGAAATGAFVASGLVPRLAAVLSERGGRLPDTLFDRGIDGTWIHEGLP